MALLRILTLIYAGVLVVALAVALTTIAVYLWRIAAALGDVRAALAQVAERTRPLRAHLQPLERLSQAHMGRLEPAAAALNHAYKRLAQPIGARARRT